jgi:hypothetical protein
MIQRQELCAVWQYQPLASPENRCGIHGRKLLYFKGCLISSREYRQGNIQRGFIPDCPRDVLT